MTQFRWRTAAFCIGLVAILSGGCGRPYVPPPPPPPPPEGFPFPPPAWTSRQTLNGDLAWSPTDRTYGDAFDRIRRAIEKAGYPEWSVYLLHGQLARTGISLEGFALVPHMETIDDAGRPLSGARWLSDPPFSLSHGWSVVKKRLLTEQVGRYRLIVLLLTPHDITPGAGDSVIIPQLAAAGRQALPRSIAASRPSSAPTLTALVYEFKKDIGKEPTRLEFASSGIEARRHLVLAGLLPATEAQ